MIAPDSNLGVQCRVPPSAAGAGPGQPGLVLVRYMVSRSPLRLSAAG